MYIHIQFILLFNYKYSIEKNKEKRGYSMKRYLSVLLFLLILLMTVSCQKNYVVSFETHFSNLKVESQNVNPGKTVLEPTIKKHSSGHFYELIGWYLDDEPYDFSTPVKSNIELMAKWKLIHFTPESNLVPRAKIDVVDDYLTHVFIAKVGERQELIYSEDDPRYLSPWVYSVYEFSDPIFIRGETDERTISIVGGWINDYTYVLHKSHASVFEGNGYYLFLTRWLEADESPTNERGFMPIYPGYMSHKLSEAYYDPSLPIDEQAYVIDVINMFLLNYKSKSN